LQHRYQPDYFYPPLMLLRLPYTYKAAVLLLFLGSLIQTATAQSSQSIAPIQLRQQTIYPVANAQQWLDNLSGTPAKTPVEAIVRFTKTPSMQQKALLREQGIFLKDYLTTNTFIAWIYPPKNGVDAGAYSLLSITPVLPSWKILPFPEPVVPGKNVELMVSCYPEITLAVFEQWVKNNGGSLLPSPLSAHSFYEISLPAEKMSLLAQWYGVRSIGPAAHDQPLNFESTTATKVNLAHMPTTSGGYGLLGDGMTIGVGDNSAGVDHVDLRDRIINYNPVPYTNHGMHINGIVGGAGILDNRAEGFAPHARLLDHLYNLVWVEP